MKTRKEYAELKKRIVLFLMLRPAGVAPGELIRYYKMDNNGYSFLSKMKEDGLIKGGKGKYFPVDKKVQKSVKKVAPVKKMLSDSLKIQQELPLTIEINGQAAVLRYQDSSRKPSEVEQIGFLETAIKLFLMNEKSDKVFLTQALAKYKG